MSGPPILRLEVNGRAATVEQLSSLALVNYGHHTAMQVRGGRVRGLRLHVDRLDEATRELFGAGLDGDRVRDHIRHALGDDGPGDASVRVIVFQPDSDAEQAIMVAVRPPADPPSKPQSLQSVRYQRPVAHLKHLGSFAQVHYGRRAVHEGYDDALLVTPADVVCEGAITNIAFFDGAEIVWPDAPALDGITMQLLEPLLADAGRPSRRGTVRLADLNFYLAAFVTNSTGVAPVQQIDYMHYRVDTDLMTTVTQLYESVPWDPI